MHNTFILKIYRGIPGEQYWEEFLLERKPFLNVIAALMEIQASPINREGKKVAPVAYCSGCLEEVCGSCSMLINGKPKQACTALIDPILKATASHVITLAPFTKYPLIRDLYVDRSRMIKDLKKVSAWIDAEDSLDRGFGPRISPELEEMRYTLSTCMTCGCCVEACPRVKDPDSTFIGPAAISQARLFNAHPIGKMASAQRNRALMGEGGVAECGNAQNCVAICPKEIPLTESIAVMGRQVGQQALKDLFSLPDVAP
jgi:succinate dehydrogenase / fumarate reductase iron-sulfur subunit